MQTHVVANLPGKQWMLVGGIVADDQDGRSVVDLAHGRSSVWLAGERGGESREVGRAVMVDVVGVQHHAGKFREQVIFLIRRAARANHADRVSAVFVPNFGEAFANVGERFFPGCGSQLAIFADERLRQPVGMLGEVEGIAALDAEEIIVDPALIAVIATNDLHAGVGATYAQRGLAAIPTMRADGAHVFHFPGARLVAVGAGGKRTDRTDVNAHAAFFAFEMIFFIGCDDGGDAAVLDTERPHVHTLAADPYAAVAQDAARAIEEHDRRPLLLILVVLRLHVPRLGGAVGEGHILQFAFAARIAYRAIQRVIAEQ